MPRRGGCSRARRRRPSCRAPPRAASPAGRITSNGAATSPVSGATSCVWRVQRLRHERLDPAEDQQQVEAVDGVPADEHAGVAAARRAEADRSELGDDQRRTPPRPSTSAATAPARQPRSVPSPRRRNAIDVGERAAHAGRRLARCRFPLRGSRAWAASRRCCSGCAGRGMRTRTPAARTPRAAASRRAPTWRLRARISGGSSSRVGADEGGVGRHSGCRPGRRGGGPPARPPAARPGTP